MARRLCFEERARIEAMAQAGLGAAQIAQRLGRHRATVYRELGRNGGPGGYDARGRRRLGPVPGRAGPRLPGWPLMLSWPRRCASASPWGGRRRRSALILGPWACGCAQRPSTGRAMTAPAGGGCPPKAGSSCPAGGAAESPEGAQSRPNARLWASSGP